MTNNNTLLKLVSCGLSLIRITNGKKTPHYILGKKHTLLDKRSSTSEVEKWIGLGIKNWALANGAVSMNLVTLDFDEKHYEGLFDLFYKRLSDDQRDIIDKCVISKTINNGTHVRYLTYHPHPTTKLSMRLIGGKFETTSEVRGQGSYALIPPYDGYSIISGDITNIPKIADKFHEEFLDILRTFNETTEEHVTRYESTNTNSFNGSRPGDIFSKNTSWNEILEPFGWIEDSKNHWRRPGKNNNGGISATTNHDGKPMFYVFSSSAHPFESNKGYSKFSVYTILNHNGDFKKSAKFLVDNNIVQLENSKSTQADKLIEIIKEKEDITLFHGENDNGFILIKNEIIALKSKAFKRWLAREFWGKYQKSPNSESLKNAINVLEGLAYFEGNNHELFNRMAWKDDFLWYDLINDAHEFIKISKTGWNTVNENPIIFKRYSHNKNQVNPSTENNDVNLIFKYINITDQNQRNLLLVYLISCFIPDFSHPMLAIFGPQGSAKSTLSKILRLIIDPSLIEVASMPKNQKELVQVLSHHSFIFFDNISYMSDEASDTLCKAITGSGFIKRELFENDEDIIYQLKKCIGVNGVNLVTTKPDLLDRSILIELERISSSDRKQESELMDEFQKDLPKILGGIFDALSKTLEIKENIKLEDIPRMADFAIWGSAISLALGHDKDDFMNAYNENISTQKETVLNDNQIAIVIDAFMNQRGWIKWSGTSSELLKELKSYAEYDLNINTRDKYWPKAPNILSRALNVIKTTFEEKGVIITNSVTSTSRTITIEKKEDMDLSSNDDTTIES